MKEFDAASGKNNLGLSDSLYHYGIIKAQNDEDVIKRTKYLIEGHMLTNSRRGRPIDIKKSFLKAVEHFAIPCNKPVNEDGVDVIESFFAQVAISSTKENGFKTLDAVAEFLTKSDDVKGTVNRDLLISMAYLSKSMHITNLDKKDLGKKLRHLKN